jgi:hypothetical protein
VAGSSVSVHITAAELIVASAKYRISIVVMVAACIRVHVMVKVVETTTKPHSAKFAARLRSKVLSRKRRIVGSVVDVRLASGD